MFKRILWALGFGPALPDRGGEVARSGRLDSFSLAADCVARFRALSRQGGAALIATHVPVAIQT